MNPLADHEAKIKLLKEKYFVGTFEAHGKDGRERVYCMKQWYANQIKVLSQMAGRRDMAKRRCKSGSAKYLEYDKAEQDLLYLVDDLIIDMVAI